MQQNTVNLNNTAMINAVKCSSVLNKWHKLRQDLRYTAQLIEG
jgi:hypothetical protein